MNKAIINTLFLLLLSANLVGQSETNDQISQHFKKQLSLFPQEKIYLHTDKNVYVAGEKIWFRAYLVNAASHKPANGSRYIYVELINPIDSLVRRVKIRPSEDDRHYGYLLVDEDLPEGSYSIRAYTNYMKNLDNNYFFHKQIRVGNPSYRRIRLEKEFTYDEAKKRISLSFSLYDQSGSQVRPKKVQLRYGEKELKPRFSKTDKTFNTHFTLINPNVPLYIECGDYKAYLDIPTYLNQYTVGFYPEGGQLIIGQRCKVAFKALAKNGLGIPVTGYIENEQGQKICEFTSLYNGMGAFYLTPEKGHNYHAVCTTTTGETLHIPLPPSPEHALTLKVNNEKDSLYINILSTNNLPERNRYLILHTRGQLQYSFELKNEEDQIVLDKSKLPSGVSSILLLNENLHPVSERLIYCCNTDQATATIKTLQKDYDLRTKVTTLLSASDLSGQLLKGSASIAVTRDGEVIPDSCSSIYTYLLLSSDLQGYIEDPNYYFRESENQSERQKALDILMLTQGWRRYDLSKLLQGDYIRPQYQIEGSFCITGSVTRGALNRPYSRAIIQLMAPQYEFITSTYANERGHFIFKQFESCDSTRYILQAFDRDGEINDLVLKVEGDIFPPITTYFPAKPIQSIPYIDNYVRNVEDKYPGILMIQLDEIVVIGKKHQAKVAVTNFNSSFTAKDIQEHGYTDIFEMLRRIPGVRILSGNKINIRSNYRGSNALPSKERPSVAVAFNVSDNSKTESTNSNKEKGDNTSYRSFNDCPPLIIINGANYDENFDLSQINVFDIERLDVYRGGDTVIFGTEGGCGVIAITTKRGYSAVALPMGRTDIFDSDKFLLGYQKPIEFYSPTYTPEEKYPKPDPRTTIYWNPNIKLDGKTSSQIDFYTADKPGTYTFVMEGITEDGKVFHEEKKINVRKE